MAVAVFDWAVWSATYPELVARGVTQAYASALFTGPVGLMLNNTDCSPIQDVPTRTTLLYMVTAHMAALYGPGSSGLVGRATSATEGSVSISLDYGTQSASAAYWLQTPYGALYWAASAPYRLFQYVPGPPSAAELPAGFYFPGARQPGQW